MINLKDGSNQKTIGGLIKITLPDFQQIEHRLKEILSSAGQAQCGNDQQRIDCLDHIIAWTHEINLYISRRTR